MIYRSEAEWFILAHSWYYVREFGWIEAAKHSLRQIHKFKSLPTKDQPPCMTYASWNVIEEAIKQIATGGL